MATGVACPLIIPQFFNNLGLPAVGGSVLTQVGGINTATYSDSGLTTPLPNPIPLNSRGEASTSAGASSQVFLTPNTVYTFTLSDALSNTIWTATYVNGVQVSGSNIGQTLYPQTAAEIAANVTPTNFGFVPGDLRRYGATAASDITAALASAASQAGQAGGASIYMAAALGTACTITAGVTFSLPVAIFGDGKGKSVISTSSDITVFTFNLAASRSLVKDLQLVGKGTGSTKPGVVYNNCNQSSMVRCKISAFNIGVQYQTGANSSYLNSIEDSEIIGNLTNNIDGQAQTNGLRVVNSTFGGSPAQIGLHLIDSSGPIVTGFDCEGTSVCAIDIDISLAYGQALGGVVIAGGFIEAGTNSGGDIRLGNSNHFPVIGTRISGMTLNAGVGDLAFLNAVNCVGVSVTDCYQNSGYSGGSLIDGWLNLGANALNITVENFSNASGSIAASLQTFGTVAFSQSPSTGSGTAITNGTTITTKGVTVVRVAPAGAVTGIALQNGIRSGQLLIIINEAALANTVTFAIPGSSNVASGTAIVIPGGFQQAFNYDTNGGLWYAVAGPFGVGTTGAQTATFTSTNKPGSGTTTPSIWIPYYNNGTVYYIPGWQ